MSLQEEEGAGLGSAGWIAFWNKGTSIYVNDRHRQVHYATIARDMADLLPGSSAIRVLDFGCGEALSADVVAGRCQSLVLCDAAANVRENLKRRFAGNPKISIASHDEIASKPGTSFDVIIANSVVQYLKAEQLQGQITQWYRLLRPGGRIILGDIIPKQTSIAADAAALLSFASQNGFLLPAIIGLTKTFFSDYRTKRAELGLLHLDEADIKIIATASGLAATRNPKNIGHNPNRMTFVLVRS